MRLNYFSHKAIEASGFHSAVTVAQANTAAKYAGALLHEERLCHATPLDDVDLKALENATTQLCLASMEGHVCIAVDNPERLQAFEIIGGAGDWTPLVLDQGRLYMRRYWQYEQDLATNLLNRATRAPSTPDMMVLAAGLDRLFPATQADCDWQRVAAAVAALKQFAVISGGPGTGKTTTLVKILALILQQQDPSQPYRIGLAAPTGKAAARMQEAIAEQVDKLELAAEFREQIPSSASTLHRLLGVRPNSVYFKHNADNPLNLDLLVVDEASMVDLALMSKLLAALPASAKLILLGDRDQLAAVEAGNVLGDICSQQIGGYSQQMGQILSQLCPGFKASEQGSSAVADGIVVLQHSYRFGANSGIGHVAKAINQGDVQTVLRVLDDPKFEDARLLPMPTGTLYERQQALAACIKPGLLKAWQSLMAAANAAEALAGLNQWRLLAAVRKGLYGVENLNALAEQLLQEAGLIQRSSDRQLDSNLYAGRPVMITRNDGATGLANGDVGVIWPDNETGQLMAYFQQQGPDGELAVIGISPARLPEHETVFAMTVHKSQGSEFDEVLLILPESEQAVVSRELVYTGVTRAKKRVGIADGGTSLLAVAQRRQHYSGLAGRLLGLVFGTKE